MKPDKIKANMDSGVLKIEIEKSEGEAMKKIPINIE
jgi:HSP20 family molecular chaperone IbpA